MAAKASAGPKLYSYVVTHDTGFAPCPYGRYCTLAYCKPRIRKAAEEGDWVVGTGSASKRMAKKIIYAMKVTKKLVLRNIAMGKNTKAEKITKITKNIIIKKCREKRTGAESSF